MGSQPQKTRIETKKTIANKTLVVINRIMRTFINYIKSEWYRIGLKILTVIVVIVVLNSLSTKENNIRLEWDEEYLSIYNSKLNSPINIHYIEAFVRSGSTNQDWVKSVIPHRTKLISKGKDETSLHLRSELPYITESYIKSFPSINNAEYKSRMTSANPTVVVDHYISADDDEVTFQLSIQNLSSKEIDVLWAQPCIWVGEFTGRGLKWYKEDHYLDACFIFLDGKLTALDATPRESEGFYTPGQVYAPVEINRSNLNPRPINSENPSNGLIGCFSKDKSMILATAWQPYQELFQGVITCMHSDFRIGGLKPGQSKTIRGKIYIVGADVKALRQRYERDFPEQIKK